MSWLVGKLKRKPNEKNDIIKKIIIPVVIASVAFLSGCGNSWEVTKKNWNSDFGDLQRHVKVYDSFTKETVWEYTGDVYLTDDSGPGDLTIIYRDSKGKVRKNDFCGQHIQAVLMEVAD